jgi:hypothetical protein
MATTTALDELMTLPEMAEAAKASPHTLRKWATRGFPDWPAEAFKLPNGSWRCRRRDFERWLDHLATPRVA